MKIILDKKRPYAILLAMLETRVPCQIMGASFCFEIIASSSSLFWAR
jgi:hypothetical protein